MKCLSPVWWRSCDNPPPMGSTILASSKLGLIFSSAANRSSGVSGLTNRNSELSKPRSWCSNPVSSLSTLESFFSSLFSSVFFKPKSENPASGFGFSGMNPVSGFPASSFSWAGWTGFGLCSGSSKSKSFDEDVVAAGIFLMSTKLLFFVTFVKKNI